MPPLPYLESEEYWPHSCPILFGRAAYEGLSGIGEGIGRLYLCGVSIAICLIFLTFGALERDADHQQSRHGISPFILLLIGLGFMPHVFFGYVREWNELIGFSSVGVGTIFLGLGFVRIFSKRAN